MLFFVLFNALANKSHKDTAVTLEMIDILVQKGVSLNQSCTCVLQIEAYTHDQKAHGSAELSYAMSLVELACYINSPEALEKLLQANWRYAKRQMTWFKRDSAIRWFRPHQFPQIGGYVKEMLSNG